MESQELMFICVLAFFWVFSVLSGLAVIMRLMTLLFPPEKDRSDLPLYAAITTVMTRLFPGTKITKIEEMK